MTNKRIKTIDLFAGCGGLMDGFEQTGLYETIGAVEWEKAPCNNLIKRLEDKWNVKDAKQRVLRFDIQRTSELFHGWENDIEYGQSCGLDKLVDEVNGIDLIIGGPPCQAYSIAGRAQDRNCMKDDYRNFLFESYLAVVDRYRPKAFIFENVPGMLSAKPGDRPIIELIKEGFKSIGYVLLPSLKDAVIDMSEYGVPQVRKRVIILGLKKAFYGPLECQRLLTEFYKVILPKQKSGVKKTVKDAIGDLPGLYPVPNAINYNGKKTSHSLPEPFVNNHICRWHSERDQDIFEILTTDIESGKNEYISSTALQELYTEKTGKTSNVHKYHVLRWDQPSNLIPAHLYKDGLRHIHPDSKQKRSITVREAARLQTFDDDYVFEGSSMDLYKMIGNAVPPLFAKHLALAVNELLGLDKED